MKKPSIAPSIAIVGASAGSGKTYTLCERYLACLHGAGAGQPEASARPSQVLATTFTKKAAAELVQRLREKLLGQGLREDALRVEDGLIGTVHSVCLSLIKDFALELGVSPDMRPVPEEDEAALFAQAVAGVMEQAGTRLRGLARRLSMDARSRRRINGLQDWKETVLELCKLARANRLSADDLRAQGKACAARCQAILPDPLSEAEAEAAVAGLRQACEDALAAIAAGRDETKKTAEAVAKMQTWLDHARTQERGFTPVWYDWQELDRDCAAKSRQAYEPVRKKASMFPRMPQFQRDLRGYVEQIFDCAADSLEAYAAWKQDYGLVDYSDMEAMALELLETPGVQQALRGRIVQVFVDEFQDTSPLQLALFLKLAGIARSSVWVGDVKQAIYGFRGTDPVLMQAAVKSIGQNPADNLRQSWRSSPDLVAFVNAFFTRTFAGMPRESVALEVPEARRGLGFPSPGLRWWHGSEDVSSAEALAERVAWVLRHSAQPAWQIVDPVTDKPRAVQAGDIGILCRSNTECGAVACALQEAGVPVDVARTGLLRQPEAVLVLCAYRMAAERRDTAAGLALLRLLRPELKDMEAWLGEVLEAGNEAGNEAEDETAKDACTEDGRNAAGDDDDLSKAGNAGEAGLPAEREALIRRRAKLDGLVSEALGEAAPRLMALREELPALAPSEALRRAASALDSLRACARWGDAGQRLANVDTLCALALQYEEACRIRHESCTHAGCIAWLMADDDRGQAPSAAGNAVQVRTYHAAKGLEWPVVVLTSLDWQPGENGAFGLRMMPPAKDMELAHPLADRKIHFWPWPCGKSPKLCSPFAEGVSGQPVAGEFARQDLDEARRLLYVGMTRARDVLVLHMAGKPKRGSKGPDGWLACALDCRAAWRLPSEGDWSFGIGGESFPVWQDDVGQEAAVEEGDEDLAMACAEGLFPVPPAGERPAGLPRLVSPSSLGQNPELAASFETIPLGGRLVWETGSRAMDAVDAGNTVHAWLCIDMPALQAGAERTERLAWFAGAWMLPDSVAEQLPGMSERLHLALCSLAAREGLGAVAGCRVEWPVCRRMADGQMLSGRIDMLAECERGVIVVDHKFETAEASPKLFGQTAKTYSGQVAAYCAALAEAGRERVLAVLHLPAQGVLLHYGKASGQR